MNPNDPQQHLVRASNDGLRTLKWLIAIGLIILLAYQAYNARELLWARVAPLIGFEEVTAGPERIYISSASFVEQCSRTGELDPHCVARGVVGAINEQCPKGCEAVVTLLDGTQVLARFQ